MSITTIWNLHDPVIVPPDVPPEVSQNGGIHRRDTVGLIELSFDDLMSISNYDRSTPTGPSTGRVYTRYPTDRGGWHPPLLFPRYVWIVRDDLTHGVEPGKWHVPHEVIVR